jgi:hypothetical protein
MIGRARPGGRTDGRLARLLGRLLTGSGERRGPAAHVVTSPDRRHRYYLLAPGASQGLR